jgi:hypothetical protein
MRLRAHCCHALSNFVGNCLAGAHVQTFDRGLEVTKRPPKPLLHLSGGRLQHQAVQRDDRHHRVIGIDPDAMPRRNFGRQSLEIWFHGRSFQNASVSSCS